MWRKTAIWISAEEYIMKDDRDVIEALEKLKDDKDLAIKVDSTVAFIVERRIGAD